MDSPKYHEVACTFCGAPRGARCRTRSSGVLLDDVHQSRSRDYQDLFATRATARLSSETAAGDEEHKEDERRHARAAVERTVQDLDDSIGLAAARHALMSVVMDASFWRREARRRSP